MTPNELAGTFDVGLYNCLSQVEQADAAVRQGDSLFDFLEVAERIFVSHNMHDRFGIALLHRHYSCMDGERLIQSRGVVRDSDALITRPVSPRPEPDRSTPAVWALEGDTFYPLEYTTDPLASDMLMRDDIPDQFIEEFRQISNGSPIGKLLGLAVVARQFYSDAKPNETPLEYSNLLPRGNVIFLSDRSVAATNAIETAWCFVPQQMSPSCFTQVSCKQITTVTCIMTCHNSDNGHPKTHQQGSVVTGHERVVKGCG